MQITADMINSKNLFKKNLYINLIIFNFILSKEFEKLVYEDVSLIPAYSTYLHNF